MDPTLAGLIHGCAAAPEDSTLHLILADWLEEHDQPARAELVRLQCRRADWVPDWRERQTLSARQDEISAAHRAEWIGPLALLCDGVTFERGLAHLTVTGRRFLTRGFLKALETTTETALIARVRITRTQTLGTLADRWPESIPELALAGLGLTDALLNPLLESPRLGRLVGLDLANNRLTSPSAVALAAASLFQNLTWLDLRNNQLVSPPLDSLMSGPCLHDLDLAGNGCEDEEQVALRTRYIPASRMLNALGMEFARIPAGSFLMGSPTDDPVARDNELPRHEVTLTRPYWLGRFAVTQGQYERVMGSNPARYHGDPRRPVELVTWEQAAEFCVRLGDLPTEKGAGRTYRLPTEAEWEHACRAGTFTPFHQGDPPSSAMLNYDGRTQYCYGGAQPGPYLKRTAEVGAYPPNAFGLYEMHGNVWEWCQDRYSGKTYKAKPVVDPAGPKRGTERVRRGGCWDAIGAYCRAAHRNGQSATEMNHYTGFRVVLLPG